MTKAKEANRIQDLINAGIELSQTTAAWDQTRVEQALRNFRQSDSTPDQMVTNNYSQTFFQYYKKQTPNTVSALLSDDEIYEFLVSHIINTLKKINNVHQLEKANIDELYQAGFDHLYTTNTFIATAALTYFLPTTTAAVIGVLIGAIPFIAVMMVAVLVMVAAASNGGGHAAAGGAAGMGGFNAVLQGLLMASLYVGIGAFHVSLAIMPAISVFLGALAVIFLATTIIYGIKYCLASNNFTEKVSSEALKQLKQDIEDIFLTTPTTTRERAQNNSYN